MFDLEQSIADWRRQMLAAGIKTPVPLKELEIHLREEIERQMRSTLTEQQAFEAAIQKIGNGNVLNDEFEKNHEEKCEGKWQRDQIWFFSVLAAVALLITICIFGARTRDQTNSAQKISALLAVAAMILPVVGGRVFWRFFPVIRKRTRDVICIVCVPLAALCWTAIFNVLVPHIDFTVGQLIVTVLWVMASSMGILGGLIMGIETAAWKKHA